MKYVYLIARILLGLVFFVFGLNKFHPFIHEPMPTGLAGQYLTALFLSHMLLIVGALEVVSGALLLVNKYVALGLTLLGPVLVNIFLFHSLLDQGELPLAGLLVILYIIVMWEHKAAFNTILMPNS